MENVVKKSGIYINFKVLDETFYNICEGLCRTMKPWLSFNSVEDKDDIEMDNWTAIL